jgi:type I restriction enzyme, S subunit
MVNPKPGWKRVKLGEVAINSTAATKDHEADGFTRYIIGKHIPDDGGRITTWNPVGDAEFGSRIRTVVAAGDVICTTRGPKLKVAVAEFDCLSAHTNFVLRPKDPTTFLPGILEAVVRSDRFQEHLRKHFRGSTNLFVNWSDAAQFEFALPKLEEQRRLSELLEATRVTAHAARAARSAARSVARAHVESRLTLFRKAYPEVPTTEVLERVTVGIVVKPTDWYTDDLQGVPALRSLNISPGALVFDDLIRISPEGHAAHAKSQLREGDVVVVRTGRPGEAAVIPANLGSLNCVDLIVTTPNKNIDPNYFALVLNSGFGKRQFSAGATGTAQQHFNVGAFKKLHLPLPPREIQASLVAEIFDVDASTEHLKRRSQKARDLGRLLMRDVVTS